MSAPAGRFQVGLVANCRTRVLVERHIDSNRTQELTIAVEHLNPTVAAVRYVEITLRIGRNIMWIVELARLIASITQDLIQLPSLSAFAMRELI